LEKTAEEIKGTGRKVLAVVAHIGKMEDINNLVAKVKREFGKIDILVNNAGTNPTMAPAIEIEERAWDVTMNVNLKGVFFLSQAVARIMIEQGGGCIINVVSAGGIRPHILPIYSISKSAVIMTTKVMALEWAKYGIRVNAVAPGLVKTRFSEALWSNKETLDYLLSRVPMRRFGELNEIMGTMLYLASDTSSFVTGTVVNVDGGETI
jgi:NAD(P)-dependent dehydrogenase (short-subunit alcohol dehydrogenase family)